MAKSGPRRIVPPQPRATLAEVHLPPTSVSPSWYRLVSARHDTTPLFWSRTGLFRFDSPDAKWGVCYAASSITAAFQEVWGDVLRQNPRVAWSELASCRVWRIRVPSKFRALELAGESLGVINATLQCFSGSYRLSQAWGAALMQHPQDIDGLLYLGRRSGRYCLALFGDEATPRPYQSHLITDRLGDLTDWTDFWPMLDRLRAKVVGLPSSLPSSTGWTEG